MKKKGTSFELENKSEWEKQKEKRKNNPLGLDDMDKHRFEDYINSLIDKKIKENSTASKKEIVAEKLTIDNYRRLQRFGYEGAKFERAAGGYPPHYFRFESKGENAVIYEEAGKIKGEIWERYTEGRDFDYISIEDLTELEFEGV
jgi:hypothetical protein